MWMQLQRQTEAQSSLCLLDVDGLAINEASSVKVCKRLSGDCRDLGQSRRTKTPKEKQGFFESSKESERM